MDFKAVGGKKISMMMYGNALGFFGCLAVPGKIETGRLKRDALFLYREGLYEETAAGIGSTGFSFGLRGGKDQSRGDSRSTRGDTGDSERGSGALGYELEIVVFNDYVLPNIALSTGELSANYFQHVPYLVSFTTQRGIKGLISVKAIHVEPMGFF
jgi:hypothetical protein